MPRSTVLPELAYPNIGDATDAYLITYLLFYRIYVEDDNKAIKPKTASMNLILKNVSARARSAGIAKEMIANVRSRM
jgi:hypothetical protein